MTETPTNNPATPVKQPSVGSWLEKPPSQVARRWAAFFYFCCVGSCAFQTVLHLALGTAPKQPWLDFFFRWLVVGLLLAGCIFLLVWVWVAALRFLKRRLRRRGARSAAEDECYALVAVELKTGALQDVVWVKALAKARGDENKAKALYIRWRVADLAEKRSAGAQRQATTGDGSAANAPGEGSKAESSLPEMPSAAAQAQQPEGTIQHASAVAVPPPSRPASTPRSTEALPPTEFHRWCEEDAWIPRPTEALPPSPVAGHALQAQRAEPKGRITVTQFVFVGLGSGLLLGLVMSLAAELMSALNLEQEVGKKSGLASTVVTNRLSRDMPNPVNEWARANWPQYAGWPDDALTLELAAKAEERGEIIDELQFQEEYRQARLKYAGPLTQEMGESFRRGGKQLAASLPAMGALGIDLIQRAGLEWPNAARYKESLLQKYTAKKAEIAEIPKPAVRGIKDITGPATLARFVATETAALALVIVVILLFIAAYELRCTAGFAHLHRASVAHA